MDEMMDSADYSFPAIEPAIRKSLSLRTFRIPASISRSNEDYAIQAVVGDERVIGQPADRKWGFVSVSRGIRMGDLVYAYHSAEDGFSGGLDLASIGFVRWNYNDPDPLIEGELVILATGKTAEGAMVQLVFAPRSGEDEAAVVPSAQPDADGAAGR